MKTTFVPVVPHSIERAKRAAKALHEVYPSRPLSFLQEVTARLYGHADWHALQKAVEAHLPSAPLDADLPDDERADRLIAQGLIVCRELEGYDPDTGGDEQVRAESVLGAWMDPGILIRKAEGAYKDQLAFEVVMELQPTARTPRAKREKHLFIDDTFCVCTMAELERLPARLGQWWSLNVRHQLEVGECLSNYKLNPRSRVALLQFGSYWAQLSTYYADTLNSTMVLGPAYLLAERYAAIWVRGMPELLAYIDALIEGGGNLPERRQGDLLKPVFLEHSNEVKQFFASYLRRDLADVFDGQPEAFLKAAERCLKIFRNPKSKQGIQKLS